MNRIFIAAFAIGMAVQACGQNLSDVPQSPGTQIPQPPDADVPQSLVGDDGKASAPPGWSYAPQGDNVLWTSARNEHGSLGEYCNTEMGFCVWILMLRGVACEEGGEHPVLLNTERLATAQTIRCMGTVAGRGSTFAFTNFEEIDTAVRSAAQLAIAIPEEGDNIVITRFPLTGAVAALDRMRQVLVERGSSDDTENSATEDAENPAGGANEKQPSRTPARNVSPVIENSA
jgi:hypothetical protein